MGVYAETYFTVICKNKKVATQVAKVLNALTKKGDQNGNTFGREIKVYDNQVEGKNESGRVQNLEYRCEVMWEAIKGIEGVETFDAPFMVEGDGYYQSKEE